MTSRPPNRKPLLPLRKTSMDGGNCGGGGSVANQKRGNGGSGVGETGGEGEREGGSGNVRFRPTEMRGSGDEN